MDMTFPCLIRDGAGCFDMTIVDQNKQQGNTRRRRAQAASSDVCWGAHGAVQISGPSVAYVHDVAELLGARLACAELANDSNEIVREHDFSMSEDGLTLMCVLPDETFIRASGPATVRVALPFVDQYGSVVSFAARPTAVQFTIVENEPCVVASNLPDNMCLGRAHSITLSGPSVVRVWERAMSASATCVFTPRPGSSRPVEVVDAVWNPISGGSYECATQSWTMWRDSMLSDSMGLGGMSQEDNYLFESVSLMSGDVPAKTLTLSELSSSSCVDVQPVRVVHNSTALGTLPGTPWSLDVVEGTACLGDRMTLALTGDTVGYLVASPELPSTVSIYCLFDARNGSDTVIALEPARVAYLNGSHLPALLCTAPRWDILHPAYENSPFASVRLIDRVALVVRAGDASFSSVVTRRTVEKHEMCGATEFLNVEAVCDPKQQGPLMVSLSGDTIEALSHMIQSAPSTSVWYASCVARSIRGKVYRVPATVNAERGLECVFDAFGEKTALWGRHSVTLYLEVNDLGYSSWISSVPVPSEALCGPSFITAIQSPPPENTPKPLQEISGMSELDLLLAILIPVVVLLLWGIGCCLMVLAARRRRRKEDNEKRAREQMDMPSPGTVKRLDFSNTRSVSFGPQVVNPAEASAGGSDGKVPVPGGHVNHRRDSVDTTGGGDYTEEDDGLPQMSMWATGLAKAKATAQSASKSASWSAVRSWMTPSSPRAHQGEEEFGSPNATSPRSKSIGGSAWATLWGSGGERHTSLPTSEAGAAQAESSHRDDPGAELGAASPATVLRVRGKTRSVSLESPLLTQVVVDNGSDSDEEDLFQDHLALSPSTAQAHPIASPLRNIKLGLPAVPIRIDFGSSKRALVKGGGEEGSAARTPPPSSATALPQISTVDHFGTNARFHNMPPLPSETRGETRRSRMAPIASVVETNIGTQIVRFATSPPLEYVRIDDREFQVSLIASAGLGVSLGWTMDNEAVVEAFKPVQGGRKGAIEVSGVVSITDQLVAINGKSTITESFASISNMLRDAIASGERMTLRFRSAIHAPAAGTPGLVGTSPAGAAWLWTNSANKLAAPTRSTPPKRPIRPTKPDLSELATGSPGGNDALYDVTINAVGGMGVTFGWTDDSRLVIESLKPGPLKDSNLVSIGDQLKTVNGVTLAGLSFAEATELIGQHQSAGDICLQFERLAKKKKMQNDATADTDKKEQDRAMLL